MGLKLPFLRREKQVRRFEIDGIDVEKEYALIQQKKSELPSAKRKVIVKAYEQEIAHGT